VAETQACDRATSKHCKTMKTQTQRKTKRAPTAGRTPETQAKQDILVTPSTRPSPWWGFFNRALENLGPKIVIGRSGQNISNFSISTTFRSIPTTRRKPCPHRPESITLQENRFTFGESQFT
jgi:hypothetical protein